MGPIRIKTTAIDRQYERDVMNMSTLC
jgi:hypothetical protein